LKFINPKISIIIPVLNNLKGLQKTINSIKAQTFSDFEVWIIDGNSSKETQEYLSKLEAPFFYQSKTDKGIYDAMNKGISLSKGEWLYFLGAEDSFFNDAVLYRVFENIFSGNIGLISGRVIYEGNSNPFVYRKKNRIKDPSWTHSMWIRNGLHHQGTFYRKRLFLNKKYPLKYEILSDYWLNLSLYKSCENCRLIDETVATCTSQGVSKSGDWSLYQEEINLKIDLSSFLFSPFFYIIVFLKFLSRKIIND
jgi:putative colanic acid biosynthesis glycosyltransferase